MKWFDGKLLKDNDPRMGVRYLTIYASVSGSSGVTHYMAKDSRGRTFKIAAARIFGDGKRRRYGFNVVNAK